MGRRVSLLAVAAALVLLLPLGRAAMGLVRPPREAIQQHLFAGVDYRREPSEEPRPLMVHIVEVDLRAPGLSFFVTPGDSGSLVNLPARTTSAFLEEFGLQMAVNGGFYDRVRAGGRGAYPDAGEPVNVKGLSISDGVVYSSDYPFLPVFCFSAGGKAQIEWRGCPDDTLQALAGNALFVVEGRSTAARFRTLNARQRNPRTAVAVDRNGDTVWIVVVDGRQRGYSEGVTLVELAEILVELGADRALNLDGGGSSTLAVNDGDGVRLLNSPVHSGIPSRQRPVANHLGVYANAR